MSYKKAITIFGKSEKGAGVTLRNSNIATKESPLIDVRYNPKKMTGLEAKNMLKNKIRHASKYIKRTNVLGLDL